MVNSKYNILDLVCCPNCQNDLISTNSFLICSSCKKKFMIKNDILILLEKA